MNAGRDMEKRIHGLEQRQALVGYGEVFWGYFWNDFSTVPFYPRERHSGQREGEGLMWNV